MGSRHRDTRCRLEVKASKVLTMTDFTDCLDTLEGTKAELEALEAQLAREHELPPACARALLLALDTEGKLGDEPLVADWRATYARFLDWTEAD